MNKIISEIELSSSVKNRPIYMAILMAVGSFIIFAAFQKIAGMPLGMVVLFTIMWFFNQNIKAFTFFEKHFVFQAAVFGKKNVAFSGLKSYDIDKKNIVIVYQNINESEKTLKFPIKIIEPTDLSRLEATIKSKMANTEIESTKEV